MLHVKWKIHKNNKLSITMKILMFLNVLFIHFIMCLVFQNLPETSHFNSAKKTYKQESLNKCSSKKLTIYLGLQKKSEIWKKYKYRYRNIEGKCSIYGT